ncbi:hypothetical protein [Mucilaginibacter sp. SG564]|nr:hypothetical protein [Mucilaginibacter sp. SG564]NOW97200.1 hypothetical protein [Mucilaginibacter sp. SG564]
MNSKRTLLVLAMIVILIIIIWISHHKSVAELKKPVVVCGK